jgi:hypothetical protein
MPVISDCFKGSGFDSKGISWGIPMIMMELTMQVKLMMLMKGTMLSTVLTPVNMKRKPKKEAKRENDEEELLRHPPLYYSASCLTPYQVSL